MNTRTITKNILFISVFIGILFIPSQAQFLEKMAQGARNLSITNGQYLKLGETAIPVLSSNLPGYGNTPGHVGLFVWYPEEQQPLNTEYIQSSIQTAGHYQEQQLGHFSRQEKGTLQLIASDDLCLSFLKESKKESEYYQGQARTGEALLQFFNDNTANTVMTDEVRENILRVIKEIPNSSLRSSLKYHLRYKNYLGLQLDISDYYGLGADPIDSAAQYLYRHPHKPTLTVFRFLQSPVVSDELKNTLNKYLLQDKLTSADVDGFKITLAAMRDQHALSIRLAHSSPVIEERLEFLQQTYTRLENFVAQHGIRPSHQAINLEERELGKDMRWITVYSQNDEPEPLKSMGEKLLQLWNETPEKPKWSLKKTEMELEAFIQQTGRLTPDTYLQNPEVSEAENELAWNIFYWRHEAPSRLEIPSPHPFDEIVAKYQK